MLIQEFEKLGSPEKAKFLGELKRRFAARAPVSDKADYAVDEEFKAAADWVFREHEELLRKLAD
jgi:hypothetical protein